MCPLRVAIANVVKPAVLAMWLLTPSSIFSDIRLLTTDITVGQNLEAAVNITLNQAAPAEGLQITVTSNDPAKLLLSRTGDIAGSRTISISVPAGLRKSPDFFVQAREKTGSVTYTASAPGYENSIGTVTLAASGIMIDGTGRNGNPLITVAGGPASRITLKSALLNSSGGFVDVQPVRQGLSVIVDISSSNQDAGTVSTSQLTIEGGSSSATTEFRPHNPGETILLVSVPAGFTRPAGLTTASVRAPGIALLNDISIGQNLQVGAHLSLGRAAPPDGLTVELTSSDARKLLLSVGATIPGSESLKVAIPAGGLGANYYLQALSNAGTVTYAASAPGYLSRTATVALTPSGVILGLLAPPDEAELFRKEAAEETHGFVASLSNRPNLSLVVYTAQLHPVHHRAADITVQPLRPGFSLTTTLESSNPNVGTIDSSVFIPAGSKQAPAQFTALSPGITVISLGTPLGFTKPGNATSLTAIVQR